MRLWRLLIYLTIIIIVCFTTEVRSAKKPKKFNPSLKPNNAKVNEKREENALNNIPLLNPETHTEEENVKEVYNNFEGICKGLIKKKGKIKIKTFIKSTLISKIINNIGKEQKEEIKKCCEKTDLNNPYSIQKCENINNKLENKIKNNTIFKQLENEIIRKRRRTKRYIIFSKPKKMIKKYFKKVYLWMLKLKELKKTSNIRKNKNVTRTKRGVIMREGTKYVLITIGLFSSFIAISSLISILTPGVIIGIAGAMFFGGITWFCLKAVNKIIKKEENEEDFISKKRKRNYSNNSDDEEEEDYFREVSYKEKVDNKGRLYTRREYTQHYIPHNTNEHSKRVHFANEHKEGDHLHVEIGK